MLSVLKAAEKLKNGHLVIFPTETVYGLGALASNNEAVKMIFQLKGRPQHNPLILHVSKDYPLKKLVQHIPKKAKILMKRFWPGPLTLCFKKSDEVSNMITAGLSTVCIRCPSHPIARQLLKKLGEPIAAPSANISGKPSSTTLSDAKRQFKKKKGVFFLEGGISPLGLESTIVDVSGKKIRLLRPGSVSVQDLEKVIKESIQQKSHRKITSPGQLLEHYAPKGKLTVIQGNRKKRRRWIQRHIRKRKTILGVIGEPFLLREYFTLCSRDNHLKTYGKNLYRFLNWCDERQAKEIFLELPKTSHPLLPTLLNRLQKASSGNIVMLQ